MTLSPSTYVGPDYPRWQQPLSDGGSVLIRTLGKQDAAAERAFIEALSPQSRRSRFLGQVAHPDDAMIERLTDIDYVNDVALAAVVPDDRGTGEKIVGVSRYAVDATRERCECAVVVADAWQRRGLGTALMKKLIFLAQERGLLVMESFDLAANHEMHALAKAFGFRVRPDPADPRQVVYTLQLAARPAVDGNGGHAP